MSEIGSAVLEVHPQPRVEVNKKVDYGIKEDDVGKMLKFEGVGDDYTFEKIRKDIARVEVVKRGFEINDKLMNKNQFGEKIGDDLEYLVNNNAELSNWFGEKSFLNKTLNYDDYINGVDLVLEFDVGDLTPKRVALDIDCTTGPTALDKKINMNMDSLVLGKRKIKYFESQIDGFKGELTCIPVIIGIDKNHVREMMDNVKDKEYLEANPAQIVFLKEITMQLDAYRGFLSESRFNYDYITREISSISKIVNQVLEEKKVLRDDKKTKEYLSKDNTFRVMDYMIGKRKSPN